jgi:hypothetical protein
MSILKSKHSGWLSDGTRTPFDGGGGGGGGQPTQSTSYNTNVPEYARPYVENMLQSTQKQIYNDDMTTFRPYTPYSTDVNNYFADFSPMQKYAQSETANMQTPGQYGAATGMTGLAGLGSLGLAGQMANTGQQFNQMAQDPTAMQGFMSPYMQNVVDYQKSQALRDYGIGSQMLKGQASRAGAFGGSRQAIQESEAQRALGSQLQGIAAQGSQKAFEDAQRQQQFGAQLGLQGQQAGLQGLGQFGQMAGQLASIGGQQQSSDLARLQAQYGMGKEQQTMEQNKINQAISNYATAQQYPFMQLGIMNSMLRGLPLQQTTTSTYQQQPSTTQQLAGLAGAGLSYFGGGRKEGGIVAMKEGGTVPGYKYGDLISDPQLQSMSQGLSPQQLQGRIADPQVNNNERDIFQSTQQAQQRMASNPMAAQQMAQAAPPPPQAPQAPSLEARMSGIAQGGGDMFNTMGYAGGGIIAFAGDGPSLVDEQRLKAEKEAAEQDAAAKEKKAPAKTATKDTKVAPKETAPASREAYLAQTQALMEKQGFKPGATADEQAYADMVAKQQAGLGEATSAKERANMAKAFLKMGSNARGFLPGAIEGAESYLTGAGEIAAGKEAREMTLAEARSKYSAAQRARAAGDIASSDKLFDEARKLESQANIAKNRDATSIRTAEIAASVAGQAGRQEEAKVDAYMKDNPGVTRSQAYAAVAQFSRGESNEIARMRAADEVLSKDMNYFNLRNSDDPKDTAKADAIRDAVYKRYGVVQNAAAPTGPVPAAVSVGGKTYNRKDYPQMTDQQWADYARQTKG